MSKRQSGLGRDFFAILDDNMLEEKKNNYIMSIAKRGIYYGISICDVTTGDFYATEIKLSGIA